MKSEFVNLFKFALNLDNNEMHIIFEQARPIMARDPEDIEKVAFAGTSVEEIAALTMDLNTARQLADQIIKHLALRERENGEE